MITSYVRGYAAGETSLEADIITALSLSGVDKPCFPRKKGGQSAKGETEKKSHSLHPNTVLVDVDRGKVEG